MLMNIQDMGSSKLYSILIIEMRNVGSNRIYRFITWSYVKWFEDSMYSFLYQLHMVFLL